MIHDFTNPISNPMHQNDDGTAMTHRTAQQSFSKRKEIESTRTTIGSYEAAAKKSLIEAHNAAISGGEAKVGQSGFYDNIRQSIGVKTDDSKRNPYQTARQGNRSSVGGQDRGNNRQSINAETGGLAIPKRPTGPTFREPPKRSYNPFG
jgi:hypothetical protein